MENYHTAVKSAAFFSNKRRMLSVPREIIQKKKKNKKKKIEFDKASENVPILNRK
jgi:hypothetical protein